MGQAARMASLDDGLELVLVWFREATAQEKSTKLDMLTKRKPDRLGATLLFDANVPNPRNSAIASMVRAPQSALWKARDSTAARRGESLPATLVMAIPGRRNAPRCVECPSLDALERKPWS